METEPSIAQESGESASAAAYAESSGQTDSSEDEESESEEEEPPSPPVLRRQKATYNKQMNRRTGANVLKYIQASTMLAL